VEQCRLQVAAELQQRWRSRPTNRRLKSIPRSSSSDREGSVTQRSALCGPYDQHHCQRSDAQSVWWTCNRAKSTTLRIESCQFSATSPVFNLYPTCI